MATAFIRQLQKAASVDEASTYTVCLCRDRARTFHVEGEGQKTWKGGK